MSKTLKWILGILAVLVVIVVVAGAFFVWRGHMMAFSYAAPVRPSVPNVQGTPNALGTPGSPSTQRGPGMPYGFKYRYPMGGWGWRMPMMGRRGFPGYGLGTGFFFLGGLLRLIIPLGILVLVAILFYQLGKNAGKQATVSPPSSNPGPSEPAPEGGQKVAKG